MRYESQENAVFIAIHPTTYRGGGFLAHGVLKNGNYIEQVFARNNTRVDEETEQFVLDWRKKFRFKGWKGYAH